MKNTFLFLSLVFCFIAVNAGIYKKEVTPTRNVILMIPDGCSLSVYSASRWMQLYKDSLKTELAIDPYVCGIVKTYNSSGVIGDSAPTTSAYMTGYLQEAGNVSIYPAKNNVENLVEIDESKTYQPLATVMEAARINLNKSIGLVATVEFPHATPADCTAHHYNRSNYNALASQQVANQIDVVISGGNKQLTEELENTLIQGGTKVIRNDVDAFKAIDGSESVWALFGDREHPYDIDRNPDEFPSLAEMTEKAILRLNQNPDGFFLMVEGSQIDWAAHSNDIVGMISEYLAFDKAVEVALEFAKQDGNTTVVILSDHGNSGMSIGRRDLKSYAKSGMDKLFKNVSEIKASNRQIENLLNSADTLQFKQIFLDQTGFDITNEELSNLIDAKGLREDDYMKKSTTKDIGTVINEIVSARHYFGFTTGGHTGEDVLLAVYHPKGEVPNGYNTNLEINAYLCDAIGLETSLDSLTEDIFAPHQKVFEGMKYSIEEKQKGEPVLIVKNKNKVLEIPAFKSTVKLNKKDLKLNSTTVYIDKNKTFYVPKELRDEILAKK